MCRPTVVGDTTHDYGKLLHTLPSDGVAMKEVSRAEAVGRWVGRVVPGARILVRALSALYTAYIVVLLYILIPLGIIAIGYSIWSDLTKESTPAEIQYRLDRLDTKLSYFEFIFACRTVNGYILEKIRTPRTAIFPSYWWNNGNYSVFASGKNRFQINGFYDAENIYGAMVRTKYSISLLQTSEYSFAVDYLVTDPPL
jgi:hypothetical protein